MKCPAGKILNPESGRCVLRTGTIGRLLLRSPKTSPRRSPAQSHEEIDALQKFYRSRNKVFRIMREFSYLGVGDSEGYNALSEKLNEISNGQTIGQRQKQPDWTRAYYLDMKKSKIAEFRKAMDPAFDELVKNLYKCNIYSSFRAEMRQSRFLGHS